MHSSWPVQFFLSHTLIKYCDSEIRVPKLHFTTHKKSEFRQELNNKKHTTVQFEMRKEFLTICLFGITGLTCNCSVVHRHGESDTKQQDEVDLDRSARDLIGYNRQRNTAFQTRIKLFGKRNNRQQRISDFGIKLNARPTDCKVWASNLEVPRSNQTWRSVFRHCSGIVRLFSLVVQSPVQAPCLHFMASLLFKLFELEKLTILRNVRKVSKTSSSRLQARRL